MLDLLKQFEEDCADDDETLRHEAAADNLASRLDGIDLGKSISGRGCCVQLSSRQRILKDFHVFSSL